MEVEDDAKPTGRYNLRARRNRFQPEDDEETNEMEINSEEQMIKEPKPKPTKKKVPKSPKKKQKPNKKEEIPEAPVVPSIACDCGWITKQADRPENQDSYLITKSIEPNMIPIWGVLDGHGGLGAKASQDGCTIIRDLIEQKIRTTSSDEEVYDHMKEIFDATHLHLLDHSRKKDAEFGTTAVVGLMTWPESNPRLTVANCGDSRAILCRRVKSKTMIIPLSDDHNLRREDELKRIRTSNGRITERENGVRRVLPNVGDFSDVDMHKKQLGLNMSRALGHLILSQYGVSPVPECKSIDIEKGDVFVAASDGLWDLMENEEVAECVELFPDSASQCCKELAAEVARRCKTQNRKSDNVTIVIVAFR